MITNDEYDLARPLASALKAKAPFVGLPMPGHAPLIFRRAFLQRVLKGVQIVNMEVETVEVEASRMVGASTKRSLVIHGVAGPRVRTSLRIHSIPRHYFKTWEGAKEMDKWTASMRKPVGIALVPKVKGLKTKLAVAAKLERELEKMGNLRRLPNPCVYTVHMHTPSEYHINSILQWRAQRRMRTVIGAIGKAYRNQPTSKLYAKLREIGITVTKYSDMTPMQRQRKGISDPFDYLRRLWEFCNLYSKPFEYGHPYNPDHRCEWDETAPKAWGPERYYPYLSELNQRRSLQAQIASIRELAQAA